MYLCGNKWEKQLQLLKLLKKFKMQNTIKIKNKNEFISLINDINSFVIQTNYSQIWEIDFKTKYKKSHKKWAKNPFVNGGLFINEPVDLKCDTYWRPRTLTTDIIPLELIKKIEKINTEGYILFEITYVFFVEKYDTTTEKTTYIETEAKVKDGWFLTYRPNVGETIRLSGYDTYPFLYEKRYISINEKRVRKLYDIAKKIKCKKSTKEIIWWFKCHASENQLSDLFHHVDGMTYQEIISFLDGINHPKKIVSGSCWSYGY